MRRGWNGGIPALAEELARLKPDVIVTAGCFQATEAARQATTTIPIVMTTGADPVSLGLVTSLARPGGNITGMTKITSALAASASSSSVSSCPSSPAWPSSGT